MAVVKDKAIGVIVYCEFPRSVKFLICKHKKGHWSFAKGHKEKGETPIETAKRELFEEAGIKKVEFYSRKIELKEKYLFTDRNKIKIKKTVDYFIAKAESKKIKIDNREIIDYRWALLKPAQKLLTFRQSKRIIKKASLLVKKKSKSKK